MRGELWPVSYQGGNVQCAGTRGISESLPSEVEATVPRSSSLSGDHTALGDALATLRLIEGMAAG